jgi:hypothetical protein
MSLDWLFWGKNPDRNFASVLEYAIVHLKVEDIVIWGHSDCNAIRALDENLQDAYIPLWLNEAREAKGTWSQRGRAPFPCHHHAALSLSIHPAAGLRMHPDSRWQTRLVRHFFVHFLHLYRVNCLQLMFIIPCFCNLDYPLYGNVALPGILNAWFSVVCYLKIISGCPLSCCDTSNRDLFIFGSGISDNAVCNPGFFCN